MADQGPIGFEDDIKPLFREKDRSRMEFAFESLDGHMHEIERDFRRQSDLDIGPIRPFDHGWCRYCGERQIEKMNAPKIPKTAPLAPTPAVWM